MQRREEISKIEDFTKLISKNQGIIHKICNVYANTSEDKEDLKQEIILQLWKSFASFQGKSKFTTWMYRVAFHTAIANIRKSKRNPILEALSKDEEKLQEKNDINYYDDEINLLYKMIAKLKDVEKALIMLYLEEKTYKEIGSIIGISEKNVSVKLVRIKDKLRNHFNKNQ